MNHVEFLKIGIDVDFTKLEELTEVKIRNSLGRIYYYTYHEAMKFVCEDDELSKIFDNLKCSIPSFHKRLITVFAEIAKHTQNLKYGKISRLLGILHTMRCDADYDMDMKLGKNDFLSMLAQLDDLKNVSQELKPDYFQVCLTPEDISLSETTIENASIKVFKKEQASIPIKRRPSLRILE